MFFGIMGVIGNILLSCSWDIKKSPTYKKQGPQTIQNMVELNSHINLTLIGEFYGKQRIQQSHGGNGSEEIVGRTGLLVEGEKIKMG